MERSSEKEKQKVAGPNDKLVVGARVIYNIKKVEQDGDVEEYICRLTA